MMRQLFIALATLVPISIAAAEPPKKILLIGQGPDGHPPATHEYMAGLKVIGKCLKPVDGLEVITVRADEPWKEGPELIGRADGVVLFLCEGGKWVNQEPKRWEALLALTKRGGGIVGLHWAIGTKDAKNIDAAKLVFGGCHGGPDRKYQVLETTLTPAAPQHPICTGIDSLRVHDELYYRLKFANDARIQPLLKARIDGNDETVAWAWERPDGGRSFGFSGLHFHENWKQLAYRRLVAQGILWTLKMPIPKHGLAVDVSDKDLTLP